MVSTSYIHGAISEPFQVTMQIWAVLAARWLMLCTRQAGLAILLVVQQPPSTQLLVRKFPINMKELFHISFASYGNSNPHYCVWITTEIWSVTGWVLFTKYYCTTTFSEIRTQRFNSSNTYFHHWRQFLSLFIHTAYCGWFLYWPLFRFSHQTSVCICALFQLHICFILPWF